MEHENDYIEIFCTYDPMEAKLVQAKLSDEQIPFTTLGDTELTITMDTFNSPISRMALKQPIKIFVSTENADRSKEILSRDNSALLSDDAEFES